MTCLTKQETWFLRENENGKETEGNLFYFEIGIKWWKEEKFTEHKFTLPKR